MHNQLERIVHTKQIEVAAAKKNLPVRAVIEKLAYVDKTRAFSQALKHTINVGNNAIIAEIKQASPSKGILTENFQPQEIAAHYAAGGASCLSVLTDRTYFRGDMLDISTAKRACTLPILRKDFTVDEYQIYQSRLIGADAILLIAAIIDDTQLYDYLQLAAEQNMCSIVEVHNQLETERALHVGATLIGINNRNLSTFYTDIQTSATLAPIASQDGATIIAESGLRNKNDLAMLNAVGIHAFLIGESLITQDNRKKAVAALV